MVDYAAHDPVLFHLPQLLDEHFLRDSRNRPFEIGEAQDISAEEVKQDHQLPAPLKKLERVLDALGCCFSGIMIRHTFWCVPYFCVRSCAFRRLGQFRKPHKLNPEIDYAHLATKAHC